MEQPKEEGIYPCESKNLGLKEDNLNTSLLVFIFCTVCFGEESICGCSVATSFCTRANLYLVRTTEVLYTGRDAKNSGTTG